MLLLINFHMAIVELFIKRSNITTFLCNSIYTHFASFSFLGWGVCVPNHVLAHLMFFSE